MKPVGTGYNDGSCQKVLKYALKLDLNLVSVYHYPSNIRSKG